MPSPISMDNCAAMKGVFLYTKHLDSELMVRCLQTLLNNFPDIKFSSVITDAKFEGYRVHFSSLDEESVLSKRFLSVSGQEIRICPLTTHLTIRDINLNGDSQFESDVRDAIRSRFGQLIESYDVPSSPNRWTENTTDWRVNVDIPEINDLQIFDHEGFPEMCMWLPNKKDKLKVTFCCRRCKKNGHVLQDCHQATQTTVNNTDESTDSNDSRRLSTDSIKPRFCFESTESYAEKLGREEVLKTGLLLEENQQDRESSVGTSTSRVNESHERDGTPLNFSSKKIKVEEDNNHTDIKDENSHSDQNSDSKIDDDDIQIIHSKPSSSSIKSEVPQNENSHEASTSSAPTTPSKAADLSFPSFLSTPGPSHTNHGGMKSSSVTSVLSRRVQECINSSCEECKVLNRDRLDAFLIHVKKKSNPIRVAGNYTRDPPGLKMQLQCILDLYYNTPETGTKEDIQFIKWLTGLIGRFEGTVPRKRKRGDRDPNSSPSKK